MPSKKKEKPFTIESIKEALLPSIANLFETQTMQMDKRFKVAEKQLGEKLSDLKSEIIHEVKILLDNDKRIEMAIDLAANSNKNDGTIKDHSKRIEKLETEVHVIKEAVKSSNL